MYFIYLSKLYVVIFNIYLLASDNDFKSFSVASLNNEFKTGLLITGLNCGRGIF